MKTQEPANLFDVLAVAIAAPHTVRILAFNRTERSAEGVVNMAVVRRGVETEFYVAVPAGRYSDGGVWRE